MKSKTPRTYTMVKRAKAAEQTAKDIIQVLGSLWLEYSLHDITLELIAERSGVTTRTILRKYGSKEGLFAAALKTDSAGIQSIKDKAIPGDIASIVSVLMEEYEHTGMASIRTLSVENEIAVAAKILRKGRKMHMQWCEHVFAPFLPEPGHAQREQHLGALYVATDVNKWKVLRKDLGYNRKETEQIFITTLHALTKHICS